MRQKKIELLSPARDLECGLAAVNCGADAVYIGAPRFGARKAAGNSIEDIERLVNYAHKYSVKVYIALNTILYDNELSEAEKLIHRLDNIGTDAIIIQDMGLLELDLPPVPIFASTQTHNYNPEKIKFLQEAGISRVILARELSLDQIKGISKAVNIELECFVHGALCVCFSGQCYFSYTTSSRSANRGECAQPCRLPYSLLDSDGNTIIKDKHLLSLKDLNLSVHLKDLIDAGISSFKIEGRLKDITYVKNITAYYRQKLDEILAGSVYLVKASSGNVYPGFTPDPFKSFNRGFTEYFYSGVQGDISSINTPKSKGELIGTVSTVRKGSFDIITEKEIVNGDGICFFNQKNELCGMNINKIESNRIYFQEKLDIISGTNIYRNFDLNFNKQLAAAKTRRRIKVRFLISWEEGSVSVKVQDEDYVSVKLKESYNLAAGDTTEEVIRRQFSKSGDSIFEVNEVVVSGKVSCHLSSSVLNELRRNALNMLEAERLSVYRRCRRQIEKNSVKYPARILDYRANIANEPARCFYKRHGAQSLENAYEMQEIRPGKVIMTTKYCIKKEMRLCPFDQPKIKYKEPLFLKDLHRKFELSFDCSRCEMQITLSGD